MSTIRTEDWHGKMTAKAAWKLGYITREEFEAWRRRSKELEKERALNSKLVVA